jgi:hypothetical protein
MLDTANDNERLAEEFGALGYPGYAYLGKDLRGTPDKIMLDALTQTSLDPRLIEALPWLLSEYCELMQEVAKQAKRLGCQNKLGFLLSIAARLPQNSLDRINTLKSVITQLDAFRLQTESSFYPMPDVLLSWTVQQRTCEAAHWKVLSTLKLENLDYDGTN